MRKLLTMSDFYDVTMQREGYVVITDSARPTLAHPADCQSLQAEHFRQKVIIGKCKNGRYTWVATMGEARELGAAPCSCNY